MGQVSASRLLTCTLLIRRLVADVATQILNTIRAKPVSTFHTTSDAPRGAIIVSQNSYVNIVNMPVLFVEKLP